METEDAFDLFGTATVQVRKQTEEEKRAERLDAKREALGLAPVPKTVFYHGYEVSHMVAERFDLAMIEEKMREWEKAREWVAKWINASFFYGASPLFKSLDLASLQSDYKMAYKTIRDWRWDTPRYTPALKILVPLPKYSASTATVVQYNPQTEETTIRLPSTPEPAWLKFQRKY